MPKFPAQNEIAGLKIERHVIDGHEFLLLTVVMHETEWIRVSDLDLVIAARRWENQAVMVGMKDAQGRCVCWLEMRFGLDLAHYDAWRMRRRVQRWVVQVSMEAYWNTMTPTLEKELMVPAPDLAKAGLASIGAGAITLTRAALSAGAAAPEVFLVGLVGAAAFWTTSMLGRSLGLLPEARDFVDESWCYEDELLLSSPRGLEVLEPSLIAAANAGALVADSGWVKQFTVPGLSLELRLAGSQSGGFEQAARVTEPQPCEQRWFPALLPTGRWLEYVAVRGGSDIARRALPTRLGEIPALHSPHSLEALKQLLEDPCCGQAPKLLSEEAPKVEAPKVEAPKVEAPKVEAPEVETRATERPTSRDTDRVERLSSALALALSARGVHTLSAAAELDNEALLACGVASSALSDTREQIRLLLAWPLATAPDVAILVLCLRETARSLSGAQAMSNLAARVERSSAGSWRRSLARLELKSPPSASEFATTLRSWAG